jgi:hypothetical protein
VQKVLLLFSFLVLFFLNSCKQESTPKHAEGFPFHYLLNTQEFMLGELKKYGQEKNQFIEVAKINKQDDSTYLKGTQVDWQHYVQPFLKINLHSEKYDSVYHMAQDINTSTNEVTITYLPVYAHLPVKKIVIIMNINSGVIKSVYAETTYNATTSSTKQKILYQSGRLIQIIEDKDSWWSSAKTSIKTIYFPEREAEVPMADFE